LQQRTSIGREPDNDIQVDTRFISRHHAVVHVGLHHTVIEDLGSTNGVVVNGQRVHRRALGDGDMVQIGKSRFRFFERSPRPDFG
jgi:general secretion pathway protein A